MGLDIGDKVPDFTIINDQDEMFDATSMIGIKPFVLYFYPKNFTPGCTKEACEFRDSYEEFQELGVEVIGVSADSVSSHVKFKKRYNLPFMFLSDTDNKLRRLFGVSSALLGILPGRETYVVNKDGIIVLKFNSIQASKHFKKAILTVKQMMNNG